MCNLHGCGAHQAMPPIIVNPADRRAFVAGGLALPLAAVLALPELAQAAAQGLQVIENQPFKGALALPKGDGPHPAVILIHEWWGLNDQIKAVAAELANQGYIALAIDLYDGVVATTAPEAMALTRAIDGAKATAQLVAAADYLRGLDGANGRLGTVGWCFGGGWSINTALATPVDACVIYYGRVPQDAAGLGGLERPVIGHFGTLDQSINRAMVTGFEAALDAAGKRDLFTPYWYEADHAFANPTGARYDAEDAGLAWQRTLDFFAENLRE